MRSCVILLAFVLQIIGCRDSDSRNTGEHLPADPHETRFVIYRDAVEFLLEKEEGWADRLGHDALSGPIVFLNLKDETIVKSEFFQQFDDWYCRVWSMDSFLESPAKEPSDRLTGETGRLLTMSAPNLINSDSLILNCTQFWGIKAGHGGTLLFVWNGSTWMPREYRKMLLF